MQHRESLITPRGSTGGVYHEPPELKHKVRCVPAVPTFSARNTALAREHQSMADRESLVTPRDLPMADRDCPPVLRRKSQYHPSAPHTGVSIYSDDAGRESLITPRDSSSASAQSLLPPRKNQSRARLSAGAILGEPLLQTRHRNILFDDKENSGQHPNKTDSQKPSCRKEATFVNQQHVSGHRVEISVFEHSGGLSIIAVSLKASEESTGNAGCRSCTKYALRLGQVDIDAVKPLAEMDTLEKV